MAAESETLFHLAKVEINSFSKWFDEKLEPFAKSSHPLELTAWRSELGLIRGLVEHPERVRIALVGTTGAGKSTFLNAVLGQEVLPVGVMQPCTAFVTAVSYSPESRYSVTVQFCTSDEWEKDLEALAGALRPGETEEDGESRSESKRLLEAARKRVQAVYGFDENFDPDAVLYAKLPAPVQAVFSAGSTQTHHFEDAKEMLSHLRKLIRGESSLWPLVKEVNISGPYDCLAGGLELVDLPGLNDPNEARVEVTREFLRTSPFVWIIFSMIRGLTQDIQQILREEKLLRTLVFSGTYGAALSLVGTKADDVDTDIASQLGLSEDCSFSELVQEYRKQTVQEARKQLEQMVRDLASPGDEGATLNRMIEMTRQVRVHTTSSSAYNKLKGVGRLRKDYGLEDESETGIPEVHDHLREIGKEAGAAFHAETARQRLEQLRTEIDFFFRARAQASSSEMDEARERFAAEFDSFTRNVRDVQRHANDQLKFYRDRFLEKMDPLLRTSVKGIQVTTEGWRAIHWATLRAIVQRDGTFRSPSTGRSFDFNESLAEPLLAQLPVSWEQYFTDDLGGIAKTFVIQITESGKNFCERIRLIVDLLFKRKDSHVEEQLAWFKDKVSLLADAARTTVFSAVRERRSELAVKIPLVAKDMMQPAYDVAKAESGPGMKRRMLDDHLEPRAVNSARPIYSTIHKDLVEGLKDLEVVIVGMFRDLTLAAEKQAEIVAHNAHIDIGGTTIDPKTEDLLNSMPR